MRYHEHSKPIENNREIIQLLNILRLGANQRLALSVCVFQKAKMIVMADAICQLILPAIHRERYIIYVPGLRFQIMSCPDHIQILVIISKGIIKKRGLKAHGVIYSLWPNVIQDVARQIACTGHRVFHQKCSSLSLKSIPEILAIQGVIHFEVVFFCKIA